jgi:hypothetical protein
MNGRKTSQNHRSAPDPRPGFDLLSSNVILSVFNPVLKYFPPRDNHSILPSSIPISFFYGGSLAQD